MRCRRWSFGGGFAVGAAGLLSSGGVGVCVVERDGEPGSAAEVADAGGVDDVAHVGAGRVLVEVALDELVRVCRGVGGWDGERHRWASHAWQRGRPHPSHGLRPGVLSWIPGLSGAPGPPQSGRSVTLLMMWQSPPASPPRASWTVRGCSRVVVMVRCSLRCQGWSGLVPLVWGGCRR